MLLLTGDTNINMLKPDEALVRHYQEILDTFGLQQMINQPTCVTRKSRSLIDHLVTNFLQRVTDTGIIPSSKVSDHDSF